MSEEMRDESVAEPLVSVCVAVYNHADYIERCLRSIAAQECTFTWEVLVGEDCSTDNTREILKRLEPSLPSNIHILYREHNLGAVGNGEDLWHRTRGKYLAGIEGDDFWLNPHKLQTQVDFLEAHPDYTVSFTQSIVVDKDSNPNGEKYPSCPDPEYSFREYFYSTMPGQTSTYVCRRQDFFDEIKKFKELKEYDFYMGDRRNAFLWLVLGRVQCIQEPWAAYRHVVDAGSSYSATVKFDETYAKNEVGFGKTLVKYAQAYGNQEAIKTAKKTYYRFWFKWSHLLGGKWSKKHWFYALRREDHPLAYLFAPLQWYFVLAMRVLRGRSVNL
ncbi:MAG: glycosyltransferase [Atopobiaceae bacterium]|jgi:glycosyltransferase involved in cell wall biosynthesis